jgi:2,4-dichlorophenol 6-monooxygenase
MSRGSRDGPELSTNLPLIRSEPIFRQLAEERNPGRILFDHNVVDFEDNGDSMLVDVKSAESGVKRYRAQYVVGADGGKFVGPRVGVRMEGPTDLVDMVGVHFKADLSEYADGTRRISCCSHHV